MPRHCRDHTVISMATAGFQSERDMQCVFQPIPTPVAASHGQDMRMKQRFNTASSPHSSTHGDWGGSFHKNQEILHCNALLMQFSSMQNWDKAAIVWVQHTILCASHFNLWGLGEHNSGRIILPCSFQPGGNLVFWKLSAFARQTLSTLVLTRPPEVYTYDHIFRNYHSIRGLVNTNQDFHL